MSSESVLSASSTSSTYKTTTFRVPNSTSYATFALAWDCAKVLQCRLKIDGVIIDTDVPLGGASLQFISGKPLRLFALPQRVVEIEVISTVDSDGSIILTTTPYGSRYDAKVVYRDAFTDIDNSPRTLVYSTGHATCK